MANHNIFSLTCHKHLGQRRAAIMPMFAFLLPVFFMVCGLAINVSYLRLAHTELKIASDATVHAAGRAMSIYQSTNSAISTASNFAPLNSVGGQPFAITSEWVKFGLSQRTGGGTGRYAFSERSKAAIDAGAQIANSVSLNGTLAVPLLVRAIPGYTSVNIANVTVATQIDRDIALILDRSGSMIWYKNQADWNYVFTDLAVRGKITSSERDQAKAGFNKGHSACPFQTYPANNNDNYTNGGSNSSYFISNNTWTKLTAEKSLNAKYLSVYEFLYDLGYVSNTRAPRHSRWSQLEIGVDAFLDVLDATDQEEFLSLTTFSTSASLNYAISTNYAPIRSYVATNYPTGSTAIGKGIETAIPSIMTAANSRTFAKKTIVVLTDGENNSSPDPVVVTQNMINQYPDITLHTVTFTPNADQTTMATVAQIGRGKHYHADDATTLLDVFKEIANNLPTILTQ